MTFLTQVDNLNFLPTLSHPAFRLQFEFWKILTLIDGKWHNIQEYFIKQRYCSRVSLTVQEVFCVTCRDCCSMSCPVSCNLHANFLLGGCLWNYFTTPLQIWRLGRGTKLNIDQLFSSLTEAHNFSVKVWRSQSKKSILSFQITDVLISPYLTTAWLSVLCCHSKKCVDCVIPSNLDGLFS